MIEINAKINVVEAKREGTSSKGNHWESQRLTLRWDEVYDAEGRTRTQYVIVELRGRDLERFEERGLKVGDEVSGFLDFDIFTTKQGFTCNDIKLCLR